MTNQSLRKPDRDFSNNKTPAVESTQNVLSQRAILPPPSLKIAVSEPPLQEKTESEDSHEKQVTQTRLFSTAGSDPPLPPKPFQFFAGAATHAAYAQFKIAGGSTIQMNVGSTADHFLENPPGANIFVNINRGLIIDPVDKEREWVAGVDKAKQMMAIALKALLESQYKPALVDQVISYLSTSPVGFDPFGTLIGNAVQGEKIKFAFFEPTVALEIIKYLESQNLTTTLKKEQLAVLRASVDLDQAWKILEKNGNTPIPPWYHLRLFKVMMVSRQGELVKFQEEKSKYNQDQSDENREKLGKAVEGIYNAILPFIQLIEAIRLDEALTDHPIYRGLWKLPALAPSAKGSQRMAPVGDSSQVDDLTIDLILKQSATSSSIAATGRKQGKEGHEARKRLLEAALRLAGRENIKSRVMGDTKLLDRPNRINAPAFPSNLDSYPALVPPFFDKAAGASHTFAMQISYVDVIDALAGIYNNRYHWELIRIPDDNIMSVVKVAEDMTIRGRRPGWGDVLGQRLQRQYQYWEADMEKAQAVLGLTDLLGAPGIGADFVTLNRVIASIGTVISTFIEILTQPSNEKKIPFDQPGLHIVRCIVTQEEPEGDATIFRAPAVAYLPVWVRTTQDMARVREEFTSHQEEAAEKRLVEIEKALENPALSAIEREQLVKEKNSLEIALKGTLEDILLNEKQLLLESKEDLEKQKSDPQQADSIQKSISQIDKRLSEIENILDSRASRISRHAPSQGSGLESPFRLPAIFVDDDGNSINLALEVLQKGQDTQNNRTRYKYYVSDSTTKDSGDQDGEWRHTREDAIEQVVRAHLESPDRYGRGYCNIRIPPRKGTTGGTATIRMVRIDKDLTALALESIDNITTVLQIAAVAAAPFTGGASLAIMLPVGIIGATPAAYRLIDRASSDTLRMDLGAAMDIVDIASSVINLGQAVRALKPMWVGRGLMMMGLGADGLGFSLAGAQFLEQIENIDPNLSPGAKRALIMQMVGQQLMNVGIQMGASLFTRGKQQYEDHTGKTGAPTLDRADTSLHETLKKESGQDTHIFVDPLLGEKTVKVHYQLDGYGLVTDIHLRVGAKADAADIKAHAATVKTLKKFSGIEGLLRNILDRITTLVRGNPKFKLGTRAWEAKLELEKLPKMITAVQERVRNGQMSASDADAFIRNIEVQIEQHAKALDDFTPGRGYIASDPKAVEAEAISQGYPRAPGGHYYTKTAGGDFQLERYPSSDAVPQRVVPKKDGTGFALEAVPVRRAPVGPTSPDTYKFIDEIKAAFPDQDLKPSLGSMIRVNAEITVHRDLIKSLKDSGKLQALFDATKNPDADASKAFFREHGILARKVVSDDYDFMTGILVRLDKAKIERGRMVWKSAQARSLFAAVAMSEVDRVSLSQLRKAGYHTYHPDLSAAAAEYAFKKNPQTVSEFVAYYQFFGESVKSQVTSTRERIRLRIDELASIAQKEGRPVKQGENIKQANREILGEETYTVESLKKKAIESLKEPSNRQALDQEYQQMQVDLGNRVGSGAMDRDLPDGELIDRVKTSRPQFSGEPQAIYHAKKHFHEIPAAEQIAGNNNMDSYYQSAYLTIGNPSEPPTVTMTATGSKSIRFVRDVGNKNMMAIVIVTPKNQVILATYMSQDK